MIYHIVIIRFSVKSGVWVFLKIINNKSLHRVDTGLRQFAPRRIVGGANCCVANCRTSVGGEIEEFRSVWE